MSPVGEGQPGAVLPPALGSQQPPAAPGWGRSGWKAGTGSGGAVTAAGHEPRGAQLAKKADGPGLSQQEQGSDLCPVLALLRLQLECCVHFWAPQDRN